MHMIHSSGLLIPLCILVVIQVMFCAVYNHLTCFALIGSLFTCEVATVEPPIKDTLSKPDKMGKTSEHTSMSTFPYCPPKRDKHTKMADPEYMSFIWTSLCNLP